MLNAAAKKLFPIFAGLALLTAMSAGDAEAQVVNSSPSATSANSQVTLRATVPSVVIVRVSGERSTLSVNVNPNVVDSASNASSRDFAISGNVIVNNPDANVQCTVSTTELKLANGSDEITVRMAGTIGGQNISTRNFTPRFSSRQAAIDITGDLDESTVTSAKAPGTYSGTFTITASLI